MKPTTAEPSQVHDAAPELLAALVHIVVSAEKSGQPLDEWAAEPFAYAREVIRCATGERA